MHVREFVAAHVLFSPAARLRAARCAAHHMGPNEKGPMAFDHDPSPADVLDSLGKAAALGKRVDESGASGLRRVERRDIACMCPESFGVLGGILL